ncbi:MAG: hypothetical protein VXV86_03885, partial [Verrucomicrobiota bacterium]|nr:hypothetical protein [Verrucomicrobiota bacterium]
MVRDSVDRTTLDESVGIDIGLEKPSAMKTSDSCLLLTLVEEPHRGSTANSLGTSTDAMSSSQMFISRSTSMDGHMQSSNPMDGYMQSSNTSMDGSVQLFPTMPINFTMDGRKQPLHTTTLDVHGYGAEFLALEVNGIQVGSSINLSTTAPVSGHPRNMYSTLRGGYGSVPGQKEFYAYNRGEAEDLNLYTNKIAPGWNGTNVSFETYMRRVRRWINMTDVAATKQGSTLASRLYGGPGRFADSMDEAALAAENGAQYFTGRMETFKDAEEDLSWIHYR